MGTQPLEAVSITNDFDSAKVGEGGIQCPALKQDGG